MFRRKGYDYFVSYMADGGVVGRCGVILDRRLDTIEQVEEIEQRLRERNGFTNVFIIGYQFMRRVK